MAGHEALRVVPPLRTLGAPDSVEGPSPLPAATPPNESAPPLAAAPPSRPVALPPVELRRARRPGWPTLAALAIATGLAAIGLGAWSVYAEARSEPGTDTTPSAERALAILADSSAARFPFRGSVGRIALVVRDDGAAVLALDGLGPAPAGRVYRAWIVRPDSATPVADTTFDASSRAAPLEHRISPGTRVAVTLEPAGDSTRPSRPLRLSAVRR